jgi:hypothetical protein
MIENPQPLWLPLLLFALPGIGFAACAVNEALFSAEDRPRCTIAAIAIVLALVPAHLLSLALGSLSAGLACAWIAIGAAGYAWIARHRRQLCLAAFVRQPILARKLALTAFATLPIVLPTILLNFHDEVNFHSHQGIIAYLQNGTYPPRYLYEPSLPLRYHYAFDLAGAIVTGLLRVRLDQAIDLLTLVLWPCMFLLLWRTGEHFGGTRAGLPVALAVCFSGGSLIFVRILAECGHCDANGLRSVPPFISYFFQHPWSIGVPIFCLVILQRAALPGIRHRMVGLVALVFSLMLLSLSEIVLFVVTILGLALTEAWNLVWFRRPVSVLVLLGLGASLLGAKIMGGFFVGGPYPPAGGIFNTGFFVNDFLRPHEVLWQIQWNLASFGLLLVLGMAGLLRARREKELLVILAVIVLVVVNSLRYRYTSEINKFGAVGLVVLSVGAGVALTDFWDNANTHVRKAIWVVLVVSLVGRGLRFPLDALAYYDPAARPPFSNQMIRPYLSGAYPVNQDDAHAVSFLRTHMAPSEIVYRTEEKSEAYAIWGGLPTQVTWYLYATERGGDDVYGLGETKFASRRDLSYITDTWFERLSAQHVTWLVTDPEDIVINTMLEGPCGRRRAVLAAQYGKVRVFRLQ